MEQFMLEQINGGGRVFYVAPRIEEQHGENEPEEGGGAKSRSRGGKPPADTVSSIKTVDSVAEKLRQGPLSSVPIHRLHGQMSHDDRERAIEAFRGGPPGILVATTIIEVGIDVPDATVMVIENPELFGLAQLHQIRGRVGRSDVPSYCFLLPGADTGGNDGNDTDIPQNEDTLERLKFLCSTQDGFKIAEWDLRHRGPGDTTGFRQSGWDDLGLADILEDAEMFRGILAEMDKLFH
jgi:ATP-dependent DNA helicase RecG